MAKFLTSGQRGRIGLRWRTLCALFIVLASVGIGSTSASAASYSSALKRYPYVSEVAGTSATLNWGTDRSQSSGSATWGTVVNGVCTPSNQVSGTSAAITIGSTSEFQWTAPLVFPGPGTYCYRVELGTTDLLGSDPSPQVKTAAASGAPFSFAVVGDFGQATTGEANVMSQIGTSPASFVVSAGDSDNTGGSDTDFGDLTQGNVFPSEYLPKIGSRPIFAAQGNHGFTTNLPYLQNFPAPIAAQSSGGRNLQESYCCISTMPGAQNFASSWYAFDWGGARFYVLEAAWADGQGGYQGDFLAHWNGAVPGCGPCGAELAWLKSDLAAHASTPIKFAFFHYPLHADSSSQGTDTYLDGANGLEGLLADNNVEIAFNGHAHQYERNLPQIPGKPLVSYITGAGGAALGSVSGCSVFDAYAVGTGSSCNAPKPTSDAHVFEFLLVTVNGNQVTVTPTDSTGQVFDQQTYTYSGSPPPDDFSISASPTSGSAAAGSAASTTINTAVTSGAAQSIDLSASGLPSGAVASFTPSTVISGDSSTMTVTTASGTTPGPYTVTVTGIGASATHSATFALTVTASTGGTPQLVQSAGSSTTRVALPAPTKAGDLLVLSAGVYTGVTKPITAVRDGGNTWTRVRATAVSGQYSDGEMWYAANAASVSSVTVTTGASAVSLNLQEFSGVAATNPLDGSNGAAGHTTSASSGPVTPTVSNDLAVGFISGHANSGPITVTSPGYLLQPQQTTLSPSTVSVKSGFQNLTTTGAQSFSGSFPAVMYWSGGIALFKAGTSPPPPPNDFSIAASPTSGSTTAGSAASTTINTAVTSGAAQTVALGATGAPAGALVSFTPSIVNSGGSSTMTVTTASGTTPGPYTVTVTGTGTSATHSTSFALTVTASTGGTPQLVQSASGTETSAATALTGSFPTATTGGHLLVLSASVYSGATNRITSVTDSAGNSWARIGSYSVSGHYSDGELWYSANANPVTTVTVHNASAASVAFELQEFSGVATISPLDSSAGISNTGTSASSGSATPSVANELAVGFVAGHGNSQAITPTASGFTTQPQQTTTGTIVTVIAGHKVLATTAGQSFSGTFGTTMYWAAAVALFKPGS